MEWIEADWPAPPWVRALTTTRLGGVSTGVYAGLNLADHVGDDPDRVAANRERLRQALGLPAEPYWLRQVHGCDVTALGWPDEPQASQPQLLASQPLAPLSSNLATDSPSMMTSAILAQPCEADAAIAWGPGQVCAVLTADCLPVLLTDRAGTRVAAIHAGWRGLAAGVIEAAVARLAVPPEALLAWLGPAIGPAAFEVGAEVREVFVAQAQTAAVAFSPRLPTPFNSRNLDIGQTEGLMTGQDRVAEASQILGHQGQWQGDARPGGTSPDLATGPNPDKWRADLYQLARLCLARLGVRAVWGGGLCTYEDSRRFYSFRRDGVTGRMASLIWIDPGRRFS